MTHLAHRMHENSLSAYHVEELKLSTRAQAVYQWILERGPQTDREVMKGMGFTDPNSVRPGITELIDKGQLMEVCTRRCPITKKNVRVVDVRGQRRLWA